MEEDILEENSFESFEGVMCDGFEEGEEEGTSWGDAPEEEDNLN